MSRLAIQRSHTIMSALVSDGRDASLLARMLGASSPRTHMSRSFRTRNVICSAVAGNADIAQRYTYMRSKWSRLKSTPAAIVGLYTTSLKRDHNAPTSASSFFSSSPVFDVCIRQHSAPTTATPAACTAIARSALSETTTTFSPAARSATTCPLHVASSLLKRYVRVAFASGMLSFTTSTFDIPDCRSTVHVAAPHIASRHTTPRRAILAIFTNASAAWIGALTVGDAKWRSRLSDSSMITTSNRGSMCTPHRRHNDSTYVG
jgi:hypothetical protein